MEVTPERNAIRRAFGGQLRALRRQARLDQSALAQLIGRSPAWISGIERGIREPSLPEFFAIARIFDEDPVALFSSIAEALNRPSRDGSKP